MTVQIQTLQCSLELISCDLNVIESVKVRRKPSLGVPVLNRIVALNACCSGHEESGDRYCVARMTSDEISRALKVYLILYSPAT